MLEFALMDENNVKSVAEIEKESFSSECWSEDLIRQELNDTSKKYLVLSLNKKVIGFAGYARVFDEGHIMNIAITKNYRGKGYGKALLKEMLTAGRNDGITSFTLEVRESNASARILYERAGFKCVGIRKNYYPDKENACIYWLYK